MAQLAEGVEHQFRMAARTLARLRGVDRPSEMLTYWPDIIRSREEGYGWDGVSVRPATPIAREVDQLDRVLEWLWLVPREHWPVVWARAAGLSWRRVAREIGTDHMTAKRRFEGAMEAVAVHLIEKGMVV